MVWLCFANQTELTDIYRIFCYNSQLFVKSSKIMEQISPTPQLEIKKITTLKELYKSLQTLMDTVPPDTKVFANI